LTFGGKSWLFGRSRCGMSLLRIGWCPRLGRKRPGWLRSYLIWIWSAAPALHAREHHHHTRQKSQDTKQLRDRHPVQGDTSSNSTDHEETQRKAVSSEKANHCMS
jgi:hypothetical protein